MNDISRKKIYPDEDLLYVLLGHPIPLARARLSKNRMWDSQKQIKCHKRIELQSQHNDMPLIEGQLHLIVIFYFAFPNCSKRRQDLLRGQAHIFKPDLDNLIKMVLDIGSGILYKDDCIISQISAKKLYDDIARTEFKLVRL